MKKILFYVAAFAIAVGCSDMMVEDFDAVVSEEASAEMVPVTLNVNFEGYDETSTRISVTPGESDDDPWVTEWEEGDPIFAYSIEQEKITSLTYVEEGESGAIFTGSVYPGENRLYITGYNGYGSTSIDDVKHIILSPTGLFANGGVPRMVSSEFIDIEEDRIDALKQTETIDVVMQHVSAALDLRMKFLNIPENFNLFITGIHIGNSFYYDDETEGYATVYTSIYTDPSKMIDDDDFIGGGTEYGHFEGGISIPITDDGVEYSAQFAILPFSIKSGESVWIYLTFNDQYEIPFPFTNNSGEDFDIARATHCYLEGYYDLGNFVFELDNSWSAYAEAFADQSAGTSSDPIEISTAEELAYLAKIANGAISGESTAGKYYKLIEDINLEGKEWESIGIESAPFQGVFDGGGKSISNLTICDDNGAYYLGLFGVVSDATIKSVVISGSIESTTTSGAAGVVAYAIGDKLVVEDCHSAINFNVPYGSANGIVGYNEVSELSVTNCSNSGSISAIYAGGIVGGSSNDDCTIMNCFNSGDMLSSGYYASGIVRSVSSSGKCIIMNCSNTGNIESTKSMTSSHGGVGGIIGHCYSGSNGIDNTIIKNCSNMGNISWSEGSLVGGIVGCIEGVSNPMYIFNCYNAGDVVGAEYVGGICGYATIWISSITFDICYNIGSISGAGDYNGTLIGYNEKAYLSNYYSLEGVLSGSSDATYSVNGTSMSVSEMQSSSFVSTLNSAVAAQNDDELESWVQGSGDYLYPIFSSQSESSDDKADDITYGGELGS